MDSNQYPDLAKLTAAVDKLLAEDVDGLPYAAKIEWLLKVRWLRDRLELQWLRDLAAVDARGAAGAEQGKRAARPLPGSKTGSTWTPKPPPARSASPEPCSPAPDSRRSRASCRRAFPGCSEQG